MPCICERADSPDNDPTETCAECPEPLTDTDRASDRPDLCADCRRDTERAERSRGARR